VNFLTAVRRIPD